MVAPTQLTCLVHGFFLALLVTTTFAFAPALGRGHYQRAHHISIPRKSISPRWEPEQLASAEEFDKARCKGSRILEAMKGSDTDAGQLFSSPTNSLRSSWQGDLKSDMNKWGWDVSSDSNQCDYSGTWHFDTPFQALGLSTKPKCHDVKHGDGKKQYNVDGKSYTTTGGYLECAMDYGAGGIIVQSRLSTKSATQDNWQRTGSNDELPALRSEADLLWGFWNRDNSNIKNIKYFWSQDVLNQNTASIIASALKNVSKEVQGWPGVTFEMSTPQGQALLGSQNGFSFGYFLASHKQELGNKAITKAQVFWGNEKDTRPVKDRNPELLFHVSNYTGGGSESPDSPDENGDEADDVCSLTTCGCGGQAKDDPSRFIGNNSLSGIYQLYSPGGTGAFPTPVNGQFEFVKDMCNKADDEHNLISISSGDPDRETVGEFDGFEDAPMLRCMGGLWGCASLVVISQVSFFIAHIWEQPSIQVGSRWDNEIWNPLEHGGHSSTIPEGQGLKFLTQADHPFDPQFKPKAFFFHPLMRRKKMTDAPRNEAAYPEFAADVRAFLQRMGLTDITFKAYDSQLAKFHLMTRGRTSPEWHDRAPPFVTPYGKVIVMYDPNKNDAEKIEDRVAGYQLWFGSSGGDTMLVAEDSWEPFDMQLPPE